MEVIIIGKFGEEIERENFKSEISVVIRDGKRVNFRKDLWLANSSLGAPFKVAWVSHVWEISRERCIFSQEETKETSNEERCEQVGLEGC